MYVQERTYWQKLSRKLLLKASRNEKAIRIAAAFGSIAAGLLFAYALYALAGFDTALSKATAETRPPLLELRTQSIVLAIIAAVVHVAGQVFLVWLPRAEAEASEALLQLGEQAERSDIVVTRSLQIISSVGQSIAALDAIVSRKSKPANAEDVRADVSELLLPYFEDEDARERVFGYERNDLYNVAVYLYEKKDDVLRSTWRYMHPAFKKAGKGLGRDWAPGKGHVGECFEQEQIIVAVDLQAAYDLPEVDRRFYGSAISIPILCAENEICGVCVITSNRKGHFGRKNDGRRWEVFRSPVETIGHILTVYVTYLISAGNGLPGGEDVTG